MDTFNKFQESSTLTAAEKSQLDKKIAVGLEGPKTHKTIFRFLVPALTVTVVMAFVLIAGLAYFTNRDPNSINTEIPGVVKISAESILKEAITTINEMKQGKDLLVFQYKETDNSPYSYTTGINGSYQLVTQTLDLNGARYKSVNEEVYPENSQRQIIQDDGSVVTQFFPNYTYVTYITDNTMYSYMDDSNNLTVTELNLDVATYDMQDPAAAQVDMLNYVLNYIKPVDYAEQTITVGEKEVKTYMIGFDYQYKGFVNNTDLQDYTYHTQIFFDAENHLPVKVVDNRVDGNTVETFQTEYLKMDYSSSTKAAKDAIFALDLTDFNVSENSDQNKLQTVGMATITGKINSMNWGEIYNKPVLETLDGKTVWLQGNSFYDWSIVRPSILSRYLVGKTVQLTGLVVNDPSYGEIMYVDSYKLISGQ